MKTLIHTYCYCLSPTRAHTDLKTRLWGAPANKLKYQVIAVRRIEVERASVSACARV
jgi:hypothetical protein